MAEPENKVVKITGAERIINAFHSVCKANLSILVRNAEDKAVAVKGKSAGLEINIEDGKEQVVGLFINDISPKGLFHLKEAKKVQAEFVMMSMKVIFVAKMVRVARNHIIISTPQQLLSLDRRKNLRIDTKPEQTAYCLTSLWQPTNDLAADPYFQHYKDISTRIHILNVSMGGFCVNSNFPSIKQVLKIGDEDTRAVLQLPMQKPLIVHIKIKWIKTIHNTVEKDKETRTKTDYRFGCEFFDLKDEAKIAIKQFIQKLSEGYAI